MIICYVFAIAFYLNVCFKWLVKVFFTVTIIAYLRRGSRAKRAAADRPFLVMD